jgi:hypothetical protein
VIPAAAALVAALDGHECRLLSMTALVGERAAIGEHAADEEHRVRGGSRDGVSRP